MRFTVLILFMLSVLSACGRPTTGSSARKQQNLTPEMMETLIASQTIFCSDQAFCPEGVARMFSINFEDNARSSMCSAFLISEDLLMTNSHCIWAGTISLAETCKGLYFAFPTPHGQSQTALCSKIIWRDRNTNGRNRYHRGDNDFALIKLDRKVAVTPFKLKNKISVGQKVFPLVTDHINGFTARVTKLDCEVESIDKRGVAILRNCPVISGNSGSAVVNEDLDVVGIIFASTDNHSRVPGGEINPQAASSTKGMAFTVGQIEATLGETLSRELQR